MYPTAKVVKSAYIWPFSSLIVALFFDWTFSKATKMISHGFEQNASFENLLPFASSLKSLSRRRENDVEFFKLVNVPFSPLRNEWPDDEDYTYRPRGHQRNGSRQLYLQSYPFSREQTVSDKVTIALRKLKAAAWAVIACNYKTNDRRKLTDSIRRKVRKYFGTCHRIPAPLSGLHVHRSMGLAAS